MVSDFPRGVPEPFQSTLADLQNKINGLPENYRDPLQADLQKLADLFAARQPQQQISLPPQQSSQVTVPAQKKDAGEKMAHPFITPIEQVLDSLIAGIIVFDQDGLVCLANDYAVSLFGFNPLGMRQDAFLMRLRAVGADGKSVPDERMPSQRAAMGEVVPNQRLTITVPHGRRYHVLASAMPLFTGAEVNGVVSIWSDVTGLHNLDEEIRQQKELLETVLNNTPYGLAILSGPDLHFRYANRAFRGLSADLAEPEGQPFRSVWRSEEGYQRARAKIEQVIATGETFTTPQEPIEQQDGTLNYFASHITRVAWEKQPAALVMIWDVTEALQAKTAAQQRTAEFEAIFDAISDAVLVFDAAGLTVRANPTAVRAMGFDASGMKRRDLAQRITLSYLDGSPVRETDLISSRVINGQEVRNLPLRYRDARGQVHTILSSGLPLPGTAGQMSGVVVTWHEIENPEEIDL